MRSPPETPAVGFGYLGELLAEAQRAIWSRVTADSNGKLVEAADARRFFESRSEQASETAFKDVVAVRSEPYQRILESVGMFDPGGWMNDSQTILDYGCGQGALENLLRERGFGGPYFGYDIDTVAIKNSAKRSRQESSTFLEANYPLAQFDVAVMCNVCVYNADGEILDILSRLSGAAKPGASLLVMEPFPVWYWELTFENLILRGRRPDRLADLLETSGWIVQREYCSSLANVFGAQLCPIAYGLVATPSPGANIEKSGLK